MMIRFKLKIIHWIFIGVASMMFITVIRMLYIYHSKNSVDLQLKPIALDQQEDQPRTGSTGVMFSGKAVRKFPTYKLKFLLFRDRSNQDTVKTSNSPQECKRWAVMTTIFKATETVRRQVRLKGWCLVVVGDKKSPLNYETGWMKGEGNHEVVYLSANKQETIKTPFLKALPWNHFGRKNIGYLYAISHGAEFIWDFDDDNMLKFFIEGAAPSGAPSLAGEIPADKVTHLDVRIPHKHNYTTYNPYPALGAPSLPLWPRGLPLADIKRENSYHPALDNTELPKESIAVLQSLADYQPDVDAIYRITMSTPFFFQRVKETKPLMIPTGVLTPYNAQATLHFRKSFWALLLPVTVNGRVSDIWRSYFAQRLFWDTGLQLGFMARPLVVQDRNPHSNLGDLNAEQDLYMKSESLVRFLGSWNGKGSTLVERIEELWVALYEHQYIELHDVELVQLWIQNLIDIGYRFPIIKDAEINKRVPDEMEIPENYYDFDNDNSLCRTDRKVKFVLSDLHDGCRMDMPSVLSSLGHEVILLGKRSHELPYPVIKMKGIMQYLNESITLHNYKTHSTPMTELMVKNNYNFYKNDVKISTADAFICMFPSSMCELWMPFNKTIIYLPAHRYNLARCTEEEWKQLNDHLQILAKMSNPKHIISASSVYDQEYLRHYTGLNPIPLYSYSGFYTANNPYAPNREEILLFGKFTELSQDINSGLKGLSIIHVNKLYGHYKLSDLMRHRAVVYFTYSVMSYKLTELYSLSIPLFIPSIAYFRNVKKFGNDRSSLSSYYCRNKTLNDQIKPHPRSTHPYSPNVQVEDDAESEYYWLQFSDFYLWPHITHFDDLEDLKRKLESADFNKIHQLMVEENEQRKNSLLHNWCKVVQKIQTGRNVPKDYNLAIKELYNTTRLMVH